MWEKVADGRREEFHGEKNIDSRLLGDDNFIDVVLAKSESLPEYKPDVNTVVEAVKKLYGVDDERLRAQGQERSISEARSLAAWATLELSGGKLTELAVRVGRDPSTLTCAVRRLEKRQERDLMLADKMEKLRQDLIVQIFKS